MDAKERMRLGDKSGASWLVITDEASGAVLYTASFAHAHWTQVPPETVRWHIQQAFVQWGKPERMRFDNGNPWGNNHRIPSALALWLVGCGIQPLFGRPCQSTDNSLVERSHRTLNQWVEPHTCVNLADLEQRLREFARIQREKYPYKAGQTRQMVHRDLYTNDRHYELEKDKDEWQIERVYTYLAQIRLYRRVEARGIITIFSRSYNLGREHKRLTVRIQFDAQTHEWVVYGERGEELKRFTPQDLTYEVIASMTLAHRKKRHKPIAVN